MKKIIFTSLILVVVVAYFFWPEKVISYPAGQTAPDQPIQQNLVSNKEWQQDEFNLKTLAEYKIKARVLSRNNFSIGRESKISPVDFALGWGPMSDQAIIDKIEVSQSNRWYHWKTETYPLPNREILLNSANVHIIPKDDLIEDKLNEVYKGSLIEMQGYLVEVTMDDGWHWRSSLRRDDTAGGSCELFLVEDLTILVAE